MLNLDGGSVVRSSWICLLMWLLHLSIVPTESLILRYHGKDVFLMRLWILLLLLLVLVLLLLFVLGLILVNLTLITNRLALLISLHLTRVLHSYLLALRRCLGLIVTPTQREIRIATYIQTLDLFRPLYQEHAESWRLSSNQPLRNPKCFSFSFFKL